MKYHVACLLAALATLLVFGSFAGAYTPENLGSLNIRKIDHSFFVILKEQASLSPAKELSARDAKARYVFNVLRSTADRTQADLRTWLDTHQIDYKPYWIQNMILVNADDTVRALIAERDEVARIVPNHRFQAIDPQVRRKAFEAEAGRDVEWNLSQIRADQVWTDLGVTGEGIIICDNDTGVDWDHPALINQYKGWDGASADHNYNWFDATGTSVSEPMDDHGHGTHTTGTIVGYDGADNHIGVAYGARWIGVKCMDGDGGGTDEWFHDAFQWILAPTDIGGSNPDPLKAPHVVNNSWGYTGGDAIFEADVEALVAAGVFIEVSAGNEGPQCGTLRSPGDYEASFTTGSTDRGGLISDFSSRGPSSLYPFIAKPEVVAPGANIRSSVPGGSYEGGWSGTSMAGPHTVGLIALMWSAAPAMIGDIESTRNAVQNSTVFSDVNDCSNQRSIPNNVYGWGEIDCYAAVNLIQPPRSAGMLDIDKPVYMCSDSLLVTLKDSDLEGSGTTGVTISSTTETTVPEMLTLIETAPGIFSRAISVSTGPASPDGILQVAENDTITCAYDDLDHGGAGPLTVTRTASVDCTAPETQDVSIDRLTAATASITWTTNEPSITAILYGETAPLNHRIALGRTHTEHSLTITGLESCTEYLFAIEAADEAGNTFIDDNMGFFYSFITYRNDTVLNENLDTDPGWLTESDWAWGAPEGNDGDPRSGYTGDNVYGFNLAGAYTNNMPKYSLVSPVLDLSQATNTTIEYALWIGCGAYPGDQAGWDVSRDGGQTWIPLFDNSYFGGAFQMDFWVPLEIDLGQLLDGYPEVMFRWTMGPTDASGVFGGWNIDDIRISYDTDCDNPTPTPRPTVTPEPTATPDHPLGVRLDLPSMVHPGETFHVTGYLDNPDAAMTAVPTFFILDVYGQFWFWPGWKHYAPPASNDIDYRNLDVPAGTTEVIVLPEFVWPETGSGQADGLWFYGAMLDPGMTSIMGQMAARQFGYGPE